MKFLFIDEFKYNYKKDYKIYGLSAVLIDSSYYPVFKKSFYKEINKIGWDKNFEFKGKSLFSSTDGDITSPIEQRIECMEQIVKLSSSDSGKSARVQVYVSIEIFNNQTHEYECYKDCLSKIIQKLPKAKVKNSKNLILVSYDENQCLGKDFDYFVESLLNEKKYLVFEQPYKVKSSLKVPGILFADYVCYFHQTFLTQHNFRRENAHQILNLLNKEEKTESDQKNIEVVINNYKKEQQTKSFISNLKKVIYV